MKRTGILLLFTLFLLNSQVQAGLFVVTDASDTTSIRSLRGAVMAANRAGGRNTIRLPGAPGHSSAQKIYSLTIPGSTDDHALTGDLDITNGDLTIIGMGQNVVIDATTLGDRIFQVFGHARLTLINVTLTGGHAPPSETSSVDPNGGAILNFGTLNLYRCTLTNNSAGDAGVLEGNGPAVRGGDGGAIVTFGGVVFMLDCVVVGNSCVSGGNGGGIRSYGTCVLDRCIISRNQSGHGASGQGLFGSGMSGGHGGSVYNNGIMTIRHCVINGNFCGNGGDGSDPSGLITASFPGGPGGDGGSGGGVYNEALMEIDDCSIYGNQTGRGGNGDSFGVAGDGGAGGAGGGIFNSGTLKLNTTTVSENACGPGANGGDGAITAGFGAPGGNGGGIYNSGFLNLTSCTIVSNKTDIGGNGGIGNFMFERSGPAIGGQGGSGGGIFNFGTNALSLRNTLVALNEVAAGGQPGTNIFYDIGSPDPTVVAGNPGAQGAGPDISGVVASRGFNLAGITDGSAGILNGSNGDIAGIESIPIDPLLGPLQMNGGSTPTHALLPGSPAIDKGNSFKIHKDQRGSRRPVNLHSIPNAAGSDGSDIGAFEVSSQ